MNKSMNLLKRFVPEMIDLIERRYNILRTILHHHPIGRRQLADKLCLGERVVRSEIDFFKSQHLIAADSSGVSLSREGEKFLIEITAFVHEMLGLASLEHFIQAKIGLKNIFIVPGDLDEDPIVLRELGKLGGKFIQETVKDGWVVAVTGGTTIAEVAKNIPRVAAKKVLVVPARGGLGQEVEIQANTIAAEIAHHLGGKYRLLHIPDGISEKTLESLLTQPKIQEVIELSRRANILLHGIGAPRVMASRRDLDWNDFQEENNQIPVGEVFGNYLAADGSVIFGTPTVGPKLEELAELNLVVAVAGGSNKGKAILAALKGGFINVLITDQGAAQVIKECLQEK